MYASGETDIVNAEASSDTGASPANVPRAHTQPSQTPSLGRRSTRETSIDDPLLGPAAAPPTADRASSSDYAVYQAKRRSTQRSSLNGSTSQALSSPSAVDQPSSLASAPFGPGSTSSIPPLVSRPSNSTLPAPSGRAYARSISEAQERLKAHVLTAELQSLGLGNDSAGAAIVQKLATAGRDTDWQYVNAAIESGKITPSFLLDHLALIEPDSGTRGSGPAFATLSGLRGRLAPDELVFLSAGTCPSLDATTDLTDSGTAQLYFGAGRPSLPPASFESFPSTMLVSNAAQLSIPRSPTANSQDQPGSRASTGARLAALFTKPLTSDSESASTRPASLQNYTDVNQNGPPSRGPTLPNLEVPVMAVGKVIRHNDIVKAVIAGSRAYLRSVVDSADAALSRSVEEHLGDFVSRFRPPTEWSTIEAISNTFQDSMEALRSNLHASHSSRIENDNKQGDEKLAAGSEAALDDRVTDDLEKFESATTSLLYDRLFLSPLSDDAQQDENLSSRIAALNVLEISLEHLGLDLGDEGDKDGYGGESTQVRDTIEEIMVDLGNEFVTLQDGTIKSPKEKLDVIVNLHKIIVDHLGKMTVPIRLKRDPDVQALAEVEMDDASLQGSQSQSGTNTPEVERAERTPRAQAQDKAETVTQLGLPPAQLTSSVHEATSSSVFDRAPNPNMSLDSPAKVKQTHSPSSSSADLILPLLIFAAVRFNPCLTSHLRFIQRFRTESLLRGEASYCLTNVQAVIEFLNHVDISTLGLDSQKVLAYTKASKMISASAARSLDSGTQTRSRRATLSNRSQDIDRVVDTANQALVKAADMLFGPKGFAPRTVEDVSKLLDGAAGSVSKARGSLLRRATNASTLSGQATTSVEEEQGASESKGIGQRELVDLLPGSGDAFDAGLTSEYATRTHRKEEDASSLSSQQGGSRIGMTSSHAKSIDSAPAIVVEEQTRTFGDRLASIPGLSRFGSSNITPTGGAAETVKPTSTSMTSSHSRSSIFSAFTREPTSPSARRTTISSISSTATSDSARTTPVGNQERLLGINERFLNMQVEDLKVAEVGQLLAEYKKLAAAIMAGQK
ncbi:hypothetical protein OIV83_005447 [Microbotryomycetes sp. JL201]|nr:hypothetical protein OIV83_005447 [Microbotryomycetes sp. JL201]